MGQPTPLKTKLWIKTESRDHTTVSQPHPPPSASPSASSHFCFSESGVAFPPQLHCSDMARSPRQRRSAPDTQPSRLLAGNERQPPGCQDDVSAVSKSGPRVRHSPGERKKPEHVYRASLSHAVSSPTYIQASPLHPAQPCTSTAHIQPTQGMKEGAVCAGRPQIRRPRHSSRAKGVTYLTWKTSVLNSCMKVFIASFQPPFDVSSFARLAPLCAHGCI